MAVSQADRNYFHINSAGDAEPCVFIHYSNTNIHDNSILEMLQSPLFTAYHDGQPFNHNHLRPCPMLENPELLQKMVHETGAHSTDTGVSGVGRASVRQVQGLRCLLGKGSGRNLDT